MSRSEVMVAKCWEWGVDLDLGEGAWSSAFGLTSVCAGYERVETPPAATPSQCICLATGGQEKGSRRSPEAARSRY